MGVTCNNCQLEFFNSIGHVSTSGETIKTKSLFKIGKVEGSFSNIENIDAHSVPFYGTLSK